MNKDKAYYTASELVPILEMKYTSVCHLLKINGIEKIENSYRVTEEQVKMLLNRNNQTLKTGMFNENILFKKKVLDDE